MRSLISCDLAGYGNKHPFPFVLERRLHCLGTDVQGAVDCIVPIEGEAHWGGRKLIRSEHKPPSLILRLFAQIHWSLPYSGQHAFVTDLCDELRDTLTRFGEEIEEQCYELALELPQLHAHTVKLRRLQAELLATASRLADLSRRRIGRTANRYRLARTLSSLWQLHRRHQRLAGDLAWQAANVELGVVD